MGARNHPFSAKRRVSLITLFQIELTLSEELWLYRKWSGLIWSSEESPYVISGASSYSPVPAIGVSSLFLSPPQGTRSCNDFWSLAKALCIFDRSSHPRIWFGPRKFSSQSQLQMFCILWSTALRDMHPIRSPVKPKLHPHLCPINHSSLQSLGQF